MKLEDLVNTGEGVIVAVVPDGEVGDREWNVFIINNKNEDITNVMVSSNGYGEIDNKKIQTSTLRWFFDKLEPASSAMIEPIMEEVFGLNNEYWVSYFATGGMCDKKFVFLPETILEENLVTIPVINKKGVMIK
jgi:hypothetical protein